MQSQQEDVRTNERFRIGVGLCTDIGHCTTQMDSTKYRWRNVHHETWDNSWRFFADVLHSSPQNITKLAFQRKSKNDIFCLCIVWKSEILIKVPLNREPQKSSKTRFSILHCWGAFQNLIAGSLLHKILKCLQFLFNVGGSYY